MLRKCLLCVTYEKIVWLRKKLCDLRKTSTDIHYWYVVLFCIRPCIPIRCIKHFAYTEWLYSQGIRMIQIIPCLIIITLPIEWFGRTVWIYIPFYVDSRELFMFYFSFSFYENRCTTKRRRKLVWWVNILAHTIITCIVGYLMYPQNHDIAKENKRLQYEE
jgi:hypothetical protein